MEKLSVNAVMDAYRLLNPGSVVLVSVGGDRFCVSDRLVTGKINGKG